MTIPRRVSQAGLRIVNSTIELVFGTAADTPAAGSKLPDTTPIDTSAGATGHTLAHNGTQFAVAVRGIAAATKGAVQTADATVTTVATYTPTDGTVVSVRATLVGRKTDGTQGASYLVVGTFRRAGGTTSLIGSATELAAHEDDVAWAATLDASGTDVRLRATGKAATTIDWHGRIEVVAVAP